MATTKQEVRFNVSDDRGPKGRFIEVEPSLTNICSSNGGEQILLAIAANCMRMIAKRDGLERAMERLNDWVINRTQITD